MGDSTLGMGLENKSGEGGWGNKLWFKYGDKVSDTVGKGLVDLIMRAEQPIVHNCTYWLLKGLAMIFACQENQFIIFRSKEIYIYFKTNNKIPINLLK